MSELKPCPFCGGKNIVLISCDEEACQSCIESCENCNMKSYAYCCSANQSGCGATGGWHTSVEKAKFNWNRRYDNGKEKSTD